MLKYVRYPNDFKTYLMFVQKNFSK